jgi:hypothetical protein
MNAYMAARRGMGAAATAPAVAPASTNWVLWGSVAVLAATAVYLYRKRH